MNDQHADRQSNYLSPPAFAASWSRVVQAGVPYNVDEWRDWHRAQCDPSLAQRAPAVYAMPLGVAIALYRMHPDSYYADLRNSTGPMCGGEFVQRLGPLILEAYSRRDFRLIGQLAMQSELAMLARQHPSNVSRRERVLRDHAATSRGLVSEHHKHPSDHRIAADLQSHLVYPQLRWDWYLDVALGYLSALPTTFLFPADLVHTAAPKPRREDPLRLLRRFWLEHLALWHESPAHLQELAVAPHCMIPHLVDRIRSTPRLPVATVTIVDPAASPPEIPLVIAECSVAVPTMLPSPAPSRPLRSARQARSGWLAAALHVLEVCGGVVAKWLSGTVKRRRRR